MCIVREETRRLEALLQVRDIQTNMEKVIKMINMIRHKEETVEEHTIIRKNAGIPIGTKQDGNAINREQALIQHDNVEIHNTHTHESIESQNRKIESHRKIKNKDNMETNTVSID